MIKQYLINLSKKINIKSFKRTFNAASIIAVAVLLIGTAMHTSKISSLKGELSEAVIKNTIIEKEKQRLDSLAKVYISNISVRDSVIKEQEKKIKENDILITSLKDSLKSVIDTANKITATESYSYINNRIKPIAEQKFKFDSVQVKYIHINLLERDGFKLLNSQLEVSLSDLKQLSYTKDNQIAELKNLASVYVSRIDIMRVEDDAKRKHIEQLSKDLRKQIFFKKVSNVAVAGLAGYIIINSLSR
jgi:hypothetical protein